MSHTQREAGFALPTVIYIVTLVTIMLAAVFVRVEADRRFADTSGSHADAVAIAHSGLQRYFAQYDSLGTRPPDGDSVRINVTGGFADVVAHVVQRPADTTANQFYLVRSTGRVIEPTQGADPQSVRTVAQFAQWQTGTMDIVAAFTAANRFDPPGPPGTEGVLDIRGGDQCFAKPTAAGVRVPGGTPSDPGGVSGSPAWSGGGSANGVATQTDIDWTAVISDAFLPDYTALVNLDTWSSYRITGDATLNNASGSGLLVVTGDLFVTGAGSAWRGAVLVGGDIHFDGTLNDFRGTVVSGLNHVGGPTPDGGVWGPSGTMTRIWYHSCYVDSSLTAVSGFAPIRNAWIDNWATY